MSARFTLFREDGVLKLKDSDRPKYKPIYVDFAEYFAHWERQRASLKNNLLAKAIGFKGQALTILDTTLGLAKDSFFFCLLGCKVIATERSKIIFSLVEDGLIRARPNQKVWAYVEKLEIHNCDAIRLADKRFDVVYIDPMYPDTKSTAAPQASMQILRDLLPEKDNMDEVMEFALKTANMRVVIKRPPRAVKQSGKLIHSYTGKAVRYDAYKP
jgi:16S rRNA (guanine1516-N2)-methyltransferase